MRDAQLLLELWSNTMKSTCITLIDGTTLQEATDVIRDGEFSDSDFHFDSSQQAAILSVWKADKDLPYVEHGGLLTRWHVSPMRRIELTFRSVENAHFFPTIKRKRNPSGWWHALE